VQRILGSRIFSQSARLARFISFAAQHALGGTGEPLKEYVVGVEVFDRTPAYDPRIDPIVRVEARRLRSKLASYYASFGRDDPVFIEFPVGTYTPVFRTRSCPAIVAVVRDPAPGLALAVLPFAPLTTAGADNGFAAGLTEEIVHRLTSLPELRLLPWDTAVRLTQHFYQFGDSKKPGALLRGSVRFDANRVRVIAQCIDASSQTYVWSEAYDRDAQNILSTQDSIAQAIVARVQATLPPEGGPEVNQGTLNLRAARGSTTAAKEHSIE
jgi:serine/threonine-protein kinase